MSIAPRTKRPHPAPLPRQRPTAAALPPRKARPSAVRVLLLLLVGLILVGAAGWLRSSPWLREPILRGKDLPELEALVQSAPSDALARYYLAKRCYLDRRFAEAATAYEAVARTEPNSARAYLGLALSRYELGQTEAARRAFQQTLQRDPRSAWAEYMLGKIAWQQGDLEQALPRVRRATQLDSRSDQAWYGLAVCYAQTRRHNDAIAALRRALERNEASAKYHTALGELLVFRNFVDEGRAHYERALALQPDYGPACALLGSYYLHQAPGPEALGRAETLLTRATRLQTLRPAEAWFDLGQLYSQTGRYAKAVAALQTSLGENGRDERVYYALANAYRRLGDTRRAAQTDARFRRLSALHIQMQDLRAQTRHRPGDAATHLRLARVYRDLGMGEQAAQQYETAMRLQPASAALAREWRHFVQAAAAPAPSDSAAAAAAAGRDFVLPPLLRP